jgi:hypothetical protein
MKEEHGAGFWGTDGLVRKYKKETPGENPKKKKNEETEGGAPTMNTSAIPDPKKTVQGKSALFKTYDVTDKRYRKDRMPRILKRYTTGKRVK